MALNFSKLTFDLGFQLPRRIALAHLYYAAGGGRQYHSVWVRGWVHVECHPGLPDAVLLEEPGKVQEGPGSDPGPSFEASKEGTCC